MCLENVSGNCVLKMCLRGAVDNVTDWQPRDQRLNPEGSSHTRYALNDLQFVIYYFFPELLPNNAIPIVVIVK